jgi:hypothetical protein
MVVFRRETEAGPAGHSVGLRGGVGSTFSQEQLIYPTLLGQRERLPRTGTVRRKRTWIGARSVRVMCIRFPLQGVHRFESPRLSDMSIACLWPSPRS